MPLNNTLRAALCTALLLCAAGSAAAQSPLLRIMIGPTFAWRDVNQAAYEADGMMAVGGGGGFRLGSGAFAFEPAFLITSKGTTVTMADGEERRLKLEYIELPIMGYVTIGSGRLRPFIAAGPVIGLEMRCKVHFIVTNSRDEVGCDLASTATFDRHKVDLSAAGAAGLDYSVGGGRRLSFETRYVHGLRNISDAEDRTLNVKNRALTFYIGYSLPINPGI